MSALHAMARWATLVSLFLLGSCPPAIAHSDLELQIKNLSAQLESQADNAQLLLQRGDLHRRHMDYSAAARDFSQARKSDHENPLVDFHEGRLALETGAFLEAVDLLQAYLAAEPGNASGWVLLGEAELGRGEPGQAAEHFSRAIGLSARPAPELFRLWVLALLADERPVDALAAVDAGLERVPGEVNLLGLGIDISLATEQPAIAQDYLDELPGRLLRLDRWSRRAEYTSCLSKGTDPQVERCLQEVSAGLRSQVEGLSAAPSAAH